MWWIVLSVYYDGMIATGIAILGYPGQHCLRIGLGKERLAGDPVWTERKGMHCILGEVRRWGPSLCVP